MGGMGSGVEKGSFLRPHWGLEEEAPATVVLVCLRPWPSLVSIWSQL